MPKGHLLTINIIDAVRCVAYTLQEPFKKARRSTTPTDTGTTRDV